MLNTLFNLPEACLYADLVDFFDSRPRDRSRDVDTGVFCDDLFLSYRHIFTDMRNSMDWIHNQGELKRLTVQNLEKYVEKDARLPLLLHRIRESGRKVMLVTNSGHEYTEQMMRYLFDFPHGPTPDTSHRSWRTYFDIIITSAQKPLFFMEGTPLREVDEVAGTLRLGSVTGSFKPGVIYAGGSSEQLCQVTGTRGENILYVGDHIFGDILKSKKAHGWRTFLVVPELDDELQAWARAGDLYVHMCNLEFILAETFRGLTADATEVPDVRHIKERLHHTKNQLNAVFNANFGSLFRSGSRRTFFAMQVRAAVPGAALLVRAAARSCGRSADEPLCRSLRRLIPQTAELPARL